MGTERRLLYCGEAGEEPATDSHVPGVFAAFILPVEELKVRLDNLAIVEALIGYHRRKTHHKLV